MSEFEMRLIGDDHQLVVEMLHFMPHLRDADGKWFCPRDSGYLIDVAGDVKCTLGCVQEYIQAAALDWIAASLEPPEAEPVEPTLPTVTNPATAALEGLVAGRQNGKVRMQMAAIGLPLDEPDEPEPEEPPEDWIPEDLKAELTRNRPLIGELEINLNQQFIVHGLIPQDAFGFVLGKSGAGKSFWALSLAAHVAAGRDFQGRPVQQGGVHYVVAEGMGGFQNRAAALIAESFPLERDMPFRVDPVSTDLSDPEHVDDLKMLIRVEKPSLLVLDTWARCSGSIDLNSSEMIAVIKNCEAIKRLSPGMTVLAVAHPNLTTSGRVEGWGGQGNAADFVLEMSADNNEGGPPSGWIDTIKLKDGSRSGRIRYATNEVLLGVDPTWGKPVTTLVLDPDPAVPEEGIEEIEVQTTSSAEQEFREIWDALQAQGKVELGAATRDDWFDMWCGRRARAADSSARHAFKTAVQRGAKFGLQSNRTHVWF